MGTGTNMIFRTDLKNTVYPIPISDIILKPPFLELIFHSAHDGEGPSSKLFLDKDFDFCPPKFRVPRAARARASPPPQWYFVLLPNLVENCMLRDSNPCHLMSDDSKSHNLPLRQTYNKIYKSNVGLLESAFKKYNKDMRFRRRFVCPQVPVRASAMGLTQPPAFQWVIITTRPSGQWKWKRAKSSQLESHAF